MIVVRPLLLCLAMMLLFHGGPGAAPSQALLIPELPFDVPVQRIQGFLSAGLQHEFGGPVTYDIGYARASGYSVTLALQVTGFDPGPAIKQHWESDTERIWSTRNRFAQPILFDLRFVGQNAHQAITVREGPGRGDMLNWYSGWPAGTGSPAPWAHEVGHYLGNYDEYPGGGVNPNGSLTNVPDSLMGTGLTLYDRHYNFIADWAAVYAVPEPSSLIIVSLGGATMLATMLIPRLRRRILR